MFEKLKLKLLKFALDLYGWDLNEFVNAFRKEAVMEDFIDVSWSSDGLGGGSFTVRGLSSNPFNPNAWKTPFPLWKTPCCIDCGTPLNHQDDGGYVCPKCGTRHFKSEIEDWD